MSDLFADLLVDHEKLEAWAKDPRVLRLGADHEDVGVLQAGLRLIGQELYPDRLQIDKDFGKGTRRGTIRLQQYRLLDEDGDAGRQTKGELVRCLDSNWHPGDLFRFKGVNVYGPHHPHMGWLPGTELGRAEKGKMSHFGGPYDPGDRIYGQAYISGAASPLELLEKHPELVAMGILMTEEQMWQVRECMCKTCRHFWYLRPGEDVFCPNDPKNPSPMNPPHSYVDVAPVIKSMDEWPRVTDWKHRLKKAGTSWAMNEETGYWIAMRFRRGPKYYRNHKNPRLLVWSEETGKAVVLMRSDYGPAKWTGKYADISPRAEKDLGIRTGQRVFVTYAADDAPLGLVYTPPTGIINAA